MESATDGGSFGIIRDVKGSGEKSRIPRRTSTAENLAHLKWLDKVAAICLWHVVSCSVQPACARASAGKGARRRVFFCPKRRVPRGRRSREKKGEKMLDLLFGLVVEGVKDLFHSEVGHNMMHAAVHKACHAVNHASNSRQNKSIKKKSNTKKRRAKKDVVYSDRKIPTVKIAKSRSNTKKKGKTK